MPMGKLVLAARRRTYSRRRPIRGSVRSWINPPYGSITRGNRLAAQQQKTVYTHYLRSEIFNISTDASGNIDDVLTIKPLQFDGATDMIDWSNFITIYDQYKIVWAKLTLFPVNPVDSSANNKPNMIVGVANDIDDNTAATSFTSILGKRNCKLSTLNKLLSFKCYARQDGKGKFIDCANETEQGYIKFWSQGLTVSTAYLQGVLEMKILFKYRH